MEKKIIKLDETKLHEMIMETLCEVMKQSNTEFEDVEGVISPDMNLGIESLM